MILLNKRRWRPKRKSQTVVKRFTKSLKIDSNIVLVAPFEKEKSDFAKKLLHEVVGGQAKFDTTADGSDTLPIRLGKKSDAPLLYNLKGFYEEDADTVRNYLGMKIEAPQAPIQQLRIPTDACLICVLDLTMTPLFYRVLSQDIAQLQKQFPERLIFACLNYEKLQQWPDASQRKRIELWSKLLGTSWIDCSLETTHGIAKVVEAVSNIFDPTFHH